MNKISEFDKCKYAQKTILNTVAEVIAYKSWSDEFKLGQINKIIENFINKIGYIDISNLTFDEANNLGFGLWSNKTNMRLIPLWILPFLDNTIKLKVEDIEGKIEEIYPNEMDNDNRFGYLAYGLWYK